MAMNVNGCTTCNAAGQEKYEFFYTNVGRKRKQMCQYDYRHYDGELFTCVAINLAVCRAKRDNWINNH